MDGPSWSLWAVPVVAFVGIAVFIATVYLAEQAQQRGGQRLGGRSISPGDRWLAGGVFRGDPRAMNSRDDVPGPEDLVPARRSAAHDELPPRPTGREREKQLAAKGG
jgi:hypothetical protein